MIYNAKYNDDGGCGDFQSFIPGANTCETGDCYNTRGGDNHIFTNTETAMLPTKT